MAAILYHNLGLRFDTPTINLYFPADDFIRFVSDLHYYIDKADLVEYPTTEVDFPVGVLGTGNRAIKIYFEHYPTFANARDKWNERKQRIHYDNIYIMMGYHHGATMTTIEHFEELPYAHKVMLTGQEFPQFPHTFCVPFANDHGHLADVWHLIYEKYNMGHRLFEHFDYVRFFNNEPYSK